MNILSICARIKFEFGAAIFEVNDDVITLFVYKVLHSDSDLKLDFNIEIKPTVRRFKICIWRDKPTVLVPRCLFIKHVLIIQSTLCGIASNHSTFI